MGKKTNSQTRKYAGKSFKSTKPNPSETPNNIPNLKSSSRYKSERNFQSLTKSSSNLLLKSSLKKSKSVDSVHKNKLVSKTYNKEHQSTNEMENLVDLVKGLEIQEEQSIKQPTSTPLIEISPQSEIESESPLSDGGISPRLQRKGSFDLNLKKSPLLSFSSSDLEDNEDFSGVDYVFSWLGNVDLLLAIIKLIEDKMNADNDVLEVGLQTIILVEDSVRFYSSVLPHLYKYLLKQSLIFSTEALNEHEQMLRMRARPKVVLARTYEEAMSLYDKYQNNILGVITDATRL